VEGYSGFRELAGIGVLSASDGVIESQNIDGENYGVEPFERFLESRRDCSSEELVHWIVEEIEVFSKDAEAGDDRTLLAFRVVESNQEIDSAAS